MILEARLLKLFVLAGIAGSCFAGEYAVLSTGFRLRVDRHEANGAQVRQYSNGGFTEMPASQIAGYEAEEQTAKAPESYTKVSLDTNLPPPAPEANKESPDARESPQALVTAAAERHGLPPAFVHSV